MPLSHSRLTFATLQCRLLEAVKHRLNNGEYTERGLSRQIGASQPHVHNVLKGVRGLSIDLGDALLTGLDMNLVEILETNELGFELEQRRPRGRATRLVPILRGRLGPDSPFPDWDDVSEWFAIPAGRFEKTRRLVLVEVGEDPELIQTLRGAEYALLDRDDPSRAVVEDTHWYAIQWRGAGLIRQLRREGHRLAVLGQTTLGGPCGPSHVDLLECSQLRIVRAKVVWAGRDPRAACDLHPWP